jgi:hypothetical protein
MEKSKNWIENPWLFHENRPLFNVFKCTGAASTLILIFSKKRNWQFFDFGILKEPKSMVL